MNFAECVMETNADGLEIRCGDIGLAFEQPQGQRVEKVPERAFLGFRPEDMCLAEAEEEGSLKGFARVLSVEAMGAETLVYLDAGAFKSVARVLGYAEMEPGSTLRYAIAAEKLHFFDAGTGKRIRFL